MAGVAGKSGGARPGAGRKPIAERYAPKIKSAEDKIAKGLNVKVDNLEFLANGGGKTVQERFEQAGTLMRDDVVRDSDGDVILDKNGRPTVVKVPVYPDLDPLEMVLIQRTVTELGPDRAANMYLIDRIAGKPTERQELSGPDGAPLVPSIQTALDKVYDEDDEDTAEPAEPIEADNA